MKAIAMWKVETCLRTQLQLFTLNTDNVYVHRKGEDDKEQKGRAHRNRETD